MTTPPADGMPTTRGTNFYCQSARKLVAGALYVRKWLRPPAPPASVFTSRECDWLPALVDWTPVPAEALADPAGGC